jgi:(1->4)-alpha-D-glucan 1-alpha-D-glucosylmutase
MNERHRGAANGDRAPDEPEELYSYETIVGMWGAPGEDGKDLPKRLETHALKALREARVHSSWIDPDPRYERAIARFIRGIATSRTTGFRDDLTRFIAEIAGPAAVESLSQVLLKVAAPGVPDFYQGTELWNFRLVDPDNRRPVDFKERVALVARLARKPAGLEPVRDLLQQEVKLLVTARSLQVRRENPDLFSDGAYIPMEVRGPRSKCVIAFARRLRSDWAVAVAPRLVARLTDRSRAPGGRTWSQTRVVLPRGAPHVWTDALTGVEAHADEGSLELSNILGSLPLAFLTKKKKSQD